MPQSLLNLSPSQREQRSLAIRYWSEGKSTGFIAKILNKKFGTKFTRTEIGKMLKVGARIFRNGQRDPSDAMTRGESDLFVGVDRIGRINNKGRRAPVETVEAVLDLEPNECRWPIGDPLEKNFQFCCIKTTLGQTYCTTHTNRSLPPIEQRKACPYRR